jgi:hypothetical protein
MKLWKTSVFEVCFLSNAACTATIWRNCILPPAELEDSAATTAIKQRKAAKEAAKAAKAAGAGGAGAGEGEDSGGAAADENAAPANGGGDDEMEEDDDDEVGSARWITLTHNP